MELENKLSEQEELNNLSESELSRIVEGEASKTTSEQIKEKKQILKEVNESAKNDFLQNYSPVQRLFCSFLYDLKIVSPERFLQNNLGNLNKMKTTAYFDTEKIRKSIDVGFKEVDDLERKLTAYEVLIDRKDKKLNSLELNNIISSNNVRKYQFSLDRANLDREKKSLQRSYVLESKYNDRLKNILNSKDLDYQRMMQTYYDLQYKAKDLELTIRTGVSPEKILDKMGCAYALVEKIDRKKNELLKKSYNVSEALSDLRVVYDASSAENDVLYMKKGQIASKTDDSFELEYKQLVEQRRQKHGRSSIGS